MINFKKFVKGIALSSAIGLSFVACGGGSSSSPSGDNTNTPTEVTVERGAVYDANVTDANGQVAIQVNGSNKYTFANTPVYPITATGGWIDVDADGQLSTNDVALDIGLKSYSTEITPITTYIANPSKSVRDSKLNALSVLVGVPKEDLLKLPSSSVTKAIVAINAIYKEMIDANSTNITQNNIQTSISTIENDVNITGLSDSKDIAKIIEEHTISGLINSGKLSRINYDKMAGLQNFRIANEKWKNIKSLSNGRKASRYAGNKINVVDGKIILTSLYQTTNDSRAELRTNLKTPISEITGKIKLISMAKKYPYAKADINAYMKYGQDGNGHNKVILSGITFKDAVIYLWAENETVTVSSPNIVGDLNATIAVNNNGGFTGDVFTAKIKTDGSKIIFTVTNETTNETYPIKELDISSYNDGNATKFSELVIRSKFDTRNGQTPSTEVQDSNVSIEFIDIQTK